MKKMIAEGFVCPNCLEPKMGRLGMDKRGGLYLACGERCSITFIPYPNPEGIGKVIGMTKDETRKLIDTARA